MENGPFEDVFPIKHGDIPASYVSLPKGSLSRIFPAIIFCVIRASLAGLEVNGRAMGLAEMGYYDSQTLLMVAAKSFQELI